MSESPAQPATNRPSIASKPRRVRHGLRLSSKTGPIARSWAARIWLQRFQIPADEQQQLEGLEYARSGQTTRMTVDKNGVHASVVGRSPKPYQVSVQVAAFASLTWDRVIVGMCDQAIYAAKLLAGQMPQSVEEIFAEAGQPLLPAPHEITVSCTCELDDTYCKHVVCVAALLAEQLDSDPFLLFALRGLDGETFLERLRHRRALLQEQGEAAAAYTPSPPTGVSGAATPLELCLDGFWNAGPEMEQVDAEPGVPEVEHALLRRLGSAPFQDSKFPLLGLLATCFDTVTRSSLEE